MTETTEYTECLRSRDAQTAVAKTLAFILEAAPANVEPNAVNWALYNHSIGNPVLSGSLFIHKDTPASRMRALIAAWAEWLAVTPRVWAHDENGERTIIRAEFGNFGPTVTLEINACITSEMEAADNG